MRAAAAPSPASSTAAAKAAVAFARSPFPSQASPSRHSAPARRQPVARLRVDRDRRLDHRDHRVPVPLAALQVGEPDHGLGDRPAVADLLVLLERVQEGLVCPVVVAHPVVGAGARAPHGGAPLAVLREARELAVEGRERPFQLPEDRVGLSEVQQRPVAHVGVAAGLGGLERFPCDLQRRLVLAGEAHHVGQRAQRVREVAEPPRRAVQGDRPFEEGARLGRASHAPDHLRDGCS
jgi:hypothetical protein